MDIGRNMLRSKRRVTARISHVQSKDLDMHGVKVWDTGWELLFTAFDTGSVLVPPASESHCIIDTLRQRCGDIEASSTHRPRGWCK
jgi:hypothetical protein